MRAATPTAFRNPHRAKPLPVLILDDERVDRHRLARLCSGLPFPCALTNAPTLDSFAQHLDAAPFGLILVDYALPDGTGLEAVDMVRLCPQNAHAPVVMISAMADDDVLAQARARGCRGFLAKDGLSKEAFADAITDALPSGDPVTLKPRYTRSETAALLALVTAQNAAQSKPMVSRLLRQLRLLRSRSDVVSQTELQALEEHCLTLWNHISALEQTEGAALLEQLAQEQPHLLGHKANRPPSPFARRN